MDKKIRYDEIARAAIYAACDQAGIPKTKAEEAQQELDAEYAEVGKAYESAWQSGQTTRTDDQTSQPSNWRSKF